jgi:hypothetical protein
VAKEMIHTYLKLTALETRETIAGRIGEVERREGTKRWWVRAFRLGPPAEVGAY